MTDFHACPSHAATYLVRAAVTAPSVHNTQPWLFVEEGRDRSIEVHADIARRLLLTDPFGREMVISCAAALFNIRLAMRHLGINPAVQPFPHPGSPTFVARVGWGPYRRPTLDEERMYGALSRRHTVRGPFRTESVPVPLIDALREHAAAEGATLHFMDAGNDRRRLAEVVRAAEGVHRTDPGHIAEQARWVRPARRPRYDGVPAYASVANPDSTLLPGRDYAGRSRIFPSPARRWSRRTGLIVVLSTDRDDRPDWLRAGQALERILLYAATENVMAAFHTQPLELPRLRARVRETLTAGEFPQMILRLGYAPSIRPVPRRPASEVLSVGDTRAVAGAR
ncbi:Acg family FMN-binding oxidoreductase [Streptomyces bobili]|uniref:Acg family FMN-binding oxidoreductase n=1 Tax=Streptomyces bobili TaxID=67280 RepID=UPI00365D0F98